jgi:DNA-binding transcriptional MocR family regulator
MTYNPFSILTFCSGEYALNDHLYQQLATLFRSEIEDGRRRPGERMPSVRTQCLARQLSKSTVLNAYGRLEAEGLIEARPRSGYFVSAQSQSYSKQTDPELNSRHDTAPLPVSTGQVIIDIMEKGAAFDLLASSEPERQPEKENTPLRRALARAYRQQSSYEQNYYNKPLGSDSLRRQIVGRMHAGGSHLEPDDIVISNGCQSALMMALMATTVPGDVVAIESPGFYGSIQLLEVLGLQIMELPSSASGGIRIDTMTEAFDRWPVAAIILSPCFSTPTGSCISDTDKQAIIALCLRHDIAMIEDDIYAELHFGLTRPRSLHSFDSSGSVLLCSSFSKCLSRDLRLGWIAPGKYREQIKRLKVVTSLSISASAQQGLADYMQQGLFERQLRQRRAQLAQQCYQLQQLLQQYLPQARSWTNPKGGLSLWLGLPSTVDTTALYHSCQTLGITITPGALFSAQQRYGNCLRLSFAHPWTTPRIAALKSIASLL